MGYEDYFSSTGRIQSEGREKREGKSLSELLKSNEQASYIAGLVFEKLGQTQLMESILMEDILEDSEKDLSLRMREEILKVKEDVDKANEMMKNGKILEEIAAINPYFIDIRKRVGLNKIASVIKFEDLVQMRLEDEAGFRQLINDPLKNYKEAAKLQGEPLEKDLEEIKNSYGISRYKIFELTRIPLADKAELDKQIKNLVKAHYPQFHKVVKRAFAEQTIYNVLIKARNANAKMNVERNEVAKKLKEIITGNDNIENQIEKNISELTTEKPKIQQREVSFKEASDLYKNSRDKLQDELSGEEAEESIATYWGEKFRVQKAIEARGRHLSEGEIDDYWRGITDVQLVQFQNECFDKYKENAKNKQLEPEKNKGSWFDSIMKMIKSLIDSKTVDNVSPNCRARMRRNR